MSARDARGPQEHERGGDVSSHSSRVAILTKWKHLAVSSVQRTRTWGTTGIVRHPLLRRRTAPHRRGGGERRRQRHKRKFTQATQWSLAIMLTRIGRAGDQITGPTADFQSHVRTGSKGKSTTASIAVICAFAATGTLATNIFLPSLMAMAADLHVSSAAITSTISVFLAIFALGQLIVGPLSDRLAGKNRFWSGFASSCSARSGARSPPTLQASWLAERYRHPAPARLPYCHGRLHEICSMARRWQRSWHR